MLKQMRVREYRAAYNDSMSTVKQINATMKALQAHIKKTLGQDVEMDDITVEGYGYDRRNGWNVHIVKVAGHGVFGFTDMKPSERCESDAAPVL